MRWLAIPRAGCLGLAAFLAATGGPAFAARFCIQSQSLPPQCIYDDPSECQQAAAQQGGVCSANPQQFTLQRGIGQYCVVALAGSSSCVYADRATCMAEAQHEHGACIAAPGIAPAKAPDPYSAVGGL